MKHTFYKAFIKTINNGRIELESGGQTCSIDNCSIESIVDGNITIKYNCPFKDGDYVNVWDLIHSAYVTCIFKAFDGDLHYYISEPFADCGKLRYNQEWMKCQFWTNDIFPATQADIDRLNSKLKKEDKVWNTETKQVEKYKWEPVEDQVYYSIFEDGLVYKCIWSSSKVARDRYALGNCFKTREEAEAKLEKIKKLLLEV